MSDILSAHAIPLAAPPPLPPHLRENLVRGMRTALRHDLARLAAMPRGTAGANPARLAILIDRIAATRADLAELEAL